MKNRSTNFRFVNSNFAFKNVARSVGLLLIMTFSFFATAVNAQIPVTVTNPGNATPSLAASYTSLANAVSALNATTAMSGPIIFTLGAGSETAPNTGLVIGSTSLDAVLSATNTVTFIATPNTATLNAGSGGTAGPGTAVQNGILALDGADYITIDGLKLVDGTTTAAEYMEWGIGLFKSTLTNGCQHNTIQNCTIILNKLNNTTASTNYPEGSRGINMMTAFLTTQTSSVLTTSAAGSNSFNRFYSNTIENCNIGIALMGTATSVVAPTAQDTANDIGGNSAATGNTIRNFGGGGTVAAYGIRCLTQREVNISYNTLISNNGSGTDHAGVLRGILNAASNPTNPANAVISNNTVTVSGSGSTVTAIEASFGGTANGANTVSITNNTIQNSSATAASGTFNGILNSSIAATLNITGNTIKTNSMTGTSSPGFNGISTTGVSPNVNVNTNTINNNSATGTGTMLLIEVSSGNTTAITSISNNILTGNFKTGVSGTFTAISSFNAAALTVNANNIYNNGINTVSGTGSGACTVYGYFNGSTTASASENITNNNIGKLLVTSPTSSTLNVLYGMNLNTTSTIAAGVTKTVSGNTIDTLISTLSTAAAGGTVSGIVNNGATTTHTANIFKNRIYTLSAGGTAGRAHGIGLITGTTTNIYNNLVGDLKAPTANSATVPTSLTTGAGIYGITIVAGTTVNLYYNTVHQDATSTGADFNTASVFAISTTTNLDMRNNIFANRSTPGSTGRSVAYRRGGTSFSSYLSTSNNNLFYAGTPGTRNLIYYDGTNSDQTLVLYKARVTPIDNLSVRENPPFLSVNGLDATFLHINTGTATQIESGGATIPTYTDDYDGNTRNASTPDIGADEFAGTPAVVVNINSVSINPPGNACVAVARTVTANVTAGSTDISSVVINYTLNGGAPLQVTMTGGIATAGATSTWTGTIPVASPATATVAWQVVATDDATSKLQIGTPYSDEPLTGALLYTSASPNPVCSGSPTQLTGILAKVDQNITVGAGAASTTGYPGPFYASQASKHLQIMWRASELIAAGLRQGNITAISFFITSGTTADNDFSIKMANTSATDMSTFVTTGFTTVFSAATFTPIVGTNTITLSTPFNWDGTSNLVMELCQGNPANSTTVSSTARVDNTSFTSAIKTSKPSGTFVSGSAMCSDNTTLIITYTQRPQIIFKGYGNLPIASIVWNDGTSNVGTTNPLTQSPVSTTTYTATATDVNGCTQPSQSPLTVTTLALPPSPNPNNSTQCGTGVPGAFVTSGGGGGGFRWYSAQTGGTLLQDGGPTYTTSISTTTIFWVSESNGSCESPRVMVTATVILPDPIQASVNNNVTCINSSVQLSVTNIAASPTNNYTYAWTAAPASGSGISGSETGTPVLITPTAAGTFTYTVTGTDGSCTAVSTVTVFVQNLPVISNITSSPVTICPGTNTTITANTADTIPGVATIGGPGAAGTGGTPFRVDGGKNQYLFTAAELTAAGIRPGAITSISFNVTSGAPLPIQNWQLSIGHSASTSQTTTFATGLTTVYGPTQVTPVVGTNTFNFTSPFIWNGTSSIVIQACQPAQTPDAITLNVSMQTIASRCVQSVLDCSSSTGTVQSTRPVITFNAQIFGYGDGNYNWLWQPGSLSGNSVSVSPSASTTYTVTATDPGSACSLTGTVTVNLFTAPPAPSGNNSEQCGTFPPAATVASNSGAGSPVFVWYDVPAGGTPLQTSTSTSYLQAVSVTTDFYVAERSSDGCEGPRVQVTAIVNVPDPLIAAASLTSICPNESVTLSVTQDGTTNTYDYTWSAVPVSGSGIPSPINSTPVTVTPTVFNTFYDYVVTGFDADKGCTVTDTVRVTVHPLPSISSVTATPSTVCSGQTIQLAATTNIGNPLHVKVGTGTTGFPGATNPYYRNQEGLKIQILYLASDILAAGFTAGPIDAISFKVTAIQAGVPSFKNYKISLANSSATNLGAGTFTTSGLIQVYGPTDFTAVIGDNVHTFTIPFVWDGVSNILFQGCYDNDPLDNCTVNCTGAVPSVEVTSVTGYNATSYANVNNTTGGLRDMCATAAATGTGTTTNASNSRANITFRRGIFNNTSAYNWQWMPGALTGPVVSTTLVNTTTYTVTATDADGCTNTGTVTATALPLPSTPVATPSTQCGIGIPAASVTGDPGVTFKWYDASTGGNLLQTGGSTYASSISTTTTFWVSASDATCEGLRAQLIATVVQPDPIIASVNDDSVCLGTAIQLTANQTGSSNTYSYTWASSPVPGSGIPSSVAGSPVTVTPTATGTYTYIVTAFDPNTANPGVGSCTVLSSIKVVVNPNPVITTAIATPPAICNGASAVLSGTSIVNPPAVVTIGQVADTTDDYNAPFDGGIEYNKHEQIMILASELQAVGAGFSTNITSLGFPSVADNAEIKNFTVKLAQTSATGLSAFVNIGLTQVYFRAIQQEVGNTNNTINFDTPFAWDGVSNLVIDICFADPAPAGGGSFYNSESPVTNTAFTSVITSHSSSVTIPAIICADVTTGLKTYTKRPIVLIGHTGNNQTNILTWTWNPGSNSGNPTTVSPTTTTTYTATASYPTGCFTESAPITVTVNPVPATPTGTNSAQCGFGVPTASVSGAGGTYNWYDAPTGGTLLQSSSSNTYTTAIGTTTTFYVAESNGNCEGGRVSVTVTVTNPDPIQASVNDNTVCPGTTIQLSAANTAGSPANTYTYSWTASPAAGSGIPSGNVPGSPASVTPTTAGTYTYTVLGTDATAGCATTATVTVTVFTPPLISTVSANPSTPVCAGQNVQLTATSNVGPPQTFKVGTGTTGISSGASPYFGAAEGFKAQYLYRAADILASGLTAGPISALSFNITNLPANTLPLQGFNIKLANTSVNDLTTGVGGWITSGMVQVYSTASSTQVLGTNTYNFSTAFIWDGVSNIVVQTCWDNDPNNGCASSCTGGTPSVEYTNSVGYAATANIFANNTSSFGRNLCDTALVSSTQTARPNVYFLRSYSNNTGLYSWQWNPGAVAGPIVTVTPSSTTSYTVTATDANGCVSNSSPLTVTVNPRPTGVISGSTSYCTGQPTTTNLSIALTGAGPWSGTLSPGAISFSGSSSPITVSVTPSSTTTYTIATLSGSQCTSIAADLSGSAIVTINPLPATPTITPAGPVTQCGGTVTLTASTPGAWQWNLEGSPIGGANNQTLVVSASGNYSVTVTNEFGCSATSAVTSVTINPVPATPTISAGGPTTFCAGGSVTLTSSSATNNQWNLDGSLIGGATNSTLVVTASGDYTVTVTNGFGCTATSAITTVTVNPLAANPTASVVQPTCALGTGTINVTAPLGAGNTYSIGGPFQSSPSFPGVSPGTYTVYVQNSAGCFSPATTNVTVNPQPFVPGAPVVTGTVNVCPFIGVNGAAGQLTYTATATGFGTQTFNWVVPPTNVTIVSGQGTPTLVLSFNNSTAPGFAAQANKQIRLTVTNQCGTSTMTIYYLAAQIPNTPAPIVGPTDACPLLGGPAVAYTITKAPGAKEYFWSVPAGASFTRPNGVGVNDTTILVSFTAGYATGPITVQSSNDCGVSGIRSLTVTRIAPSQPNIISGPTNACPYITPNAPATYTVPAVPGVTYTWSGTNGAVMSSPQGSNTMSVSYPIGYTGGTISVTATTGCGTSAAKNLTITTLNPATPGVPDVIQTHFCGEPGGRKFTYTLSSTPANATSVVWTVPAGATFINLTPISIEVTYPDVAVSGVVTVQATNPCANSVVRSVSVKLAACSGGGGNSGSAGTKGLATVKAVKSTPAPVQAETMEVKIFPNPTVSDFKLEVLTSAQEEIYVRVIDAQGKLSKSFKLMPYQTIALGAELKAGSYLIEVRQGTVVKTSRVIKF
ncbi:MAG: T9SS type A sorting domain-containing protein [Ferruginibacter sp.]